MKPLAITQWLWLSKVSRVVRWVQRYAAYQWRASSHLIIPSKNLWKHRVQDSHAVSVQRKIQVLRKTWIPRIAWECDYRGYHLSVALIASSEAQDEARLAHESNKERKDFTCLHDSETRVRTTAHSDNTATLTLPDSYTRLRTNIVCDIEVSVVCPWHNSRLKILIDFLEQSTSVRNDGKTDSGSALLHYRQSTDSTRARPCKSQGLNPLRRRSLSRPGSLHDWHNLPIEDISRL